MKTYQLQSSSFIDAPSIVSMAMAQFAWDKKWAVSLVANTWGIPQAAARALVSKKVPFTICEGDRVVFSF